MMMMMMMMMMMLMLMLMMMMMMMMLMMMMLVMMMMMLGLLALYLIRCNNRITDYAGTVRYFFLFTFTIQQATHYVEKPETFVSDVINCGLYIFSPSIFKHMGEILLRNYEQARLVVICFIDLSLFE